MQSYLEKLIPMLTVSSPEKPIPKKIIKALEKTKHDS